MFTVRNSEFHTCITGVCNRRLLQSLDLRQKWNVAAEVIGISKGKEYDPYAIDNSILIEIPEISFSQLHNKHEYAMIGGHMLHRSTHDVQKNYKDFCCDFAIMKIPSSSHEHFKFSYTHTRQEYATRMSKFGFAHRSQRG